MKNRFLKFLSTLLGVIITISCMIISSSSAKSDYNPNKSVNVKRILVKYKTNVKNAAEKVQKKKNNKKVKEFKKTRNDNVYIIDIESENFNELLLDSDIELIEEDAIVQILDRDMYEEEIEEHPEHERSCCISFDGSHAVCNGDCDCETDCNCGLCVKDNFGEDDTDYTDEPNNTEIIESPKEPLEPEPEEMEIETLETGTAGKQNIYGDKVPWNITRIKADRLHDMGITGAGVKVAVFDTGIDLDNPDLNVAGGISFVDGVTSYDDDNGHGTAMAGILAASLNGSGLVGVAPSIELYSVKVLDSYGMGRYSSVLQAIDWAIENDIDIITMSFGGSQYSQILSEAIKKASDKNIMIFAAAGNTGSNGIYYPAAFPHVVCVGSTDSNNTVAAFSNRGEQMNLVAPGVAVETLGMNNSNTYVDGTSASVQHAAGVAALLLGANKNITNGHIMFLLYYNAYVLGDIEIYGNGLVDAKKAYENLCTGKYYIPIIDENGEERIIYGQVGIGEDGIVFAQAACSKCSCSDCSKGSSFYNYAEHSSGGHRRVYYCGSSSCKSKHTYTCVYASNEFDKFTNCCSCQGSHLYDNTCDSTCNRCGAQRTISHTYSNNCDTTCNVCGYTRTISHTYSNNCDTTCNVCGYTRSISHTYSNNCDSTCNVCSASRTPPHASIKWDSSHSSTHYNDPAGSGHIRWGRCSSCSILLTFVFESDSSCCSCGYHSWSSSLSKVHKGSYDEYYKYCTKSGCSAKSLYGTYTCSCHTCSYTTKVYGSHTSTGHDVYKKCSCGSQSYQGYKEANPNCISCTTPPTVIIKGPKAGAILCELDTSVKPQIDVQDNENDTLTCKYYIDSETTPRGTETVTGTSSTKTVTFATGVNAASLSEGSHTLKVEVKDSIAPVGTKTITFKVDKSAPSIATPTISSSANSITVTVSATDSGAGLDQYPYRFTIGNETTGWLSSNIYTSSATLMPNTQYSVKVEVRDATTAKHTAQYSTNVYTRAAVPDITVSNCTQTTFDCTISDNNPSNTYYQIVVGNKYVSQSGSLVDSATWITLTNKKITVTGLTANTSYTVKAKAKNASGVDTGYSSSKTATTLQLPPATPAGLSKHTATQTSITLVWSLVNGADSYDIERIDPQSGSQIFTGVTTSPFTDVNLAVNKSYQYRIRAKNTGGSSSWSEIINISTLPYPPGKPTGLSAQLSPGTILLSWNGLSDATSYDVFVNGTFVENVTDPLFEHNNLMPDTQYEYQVRGKNAGGEGDLSPKLIKYSLPNIPVNANIESVTNTSIQVAWEANSNPSSVKYKIGAFDDQDVLIKETQPSYNLFSVLTGLTPSTQYQIKIKAYNSQGAETEWVLIGNTETLPNPPGVPVGITAVSRDTSITLRWNDVYGAESYDIELNGTVVASDLSVASFTDTGLEPETTYQYRVRAKNAGGASEWSSIIQKTTLPTQPTAPANPATASGTTSISVTWDEVISATGYDIEVDGQIVNTGASTHYVHNGLNPGSFHTYRVRARNEAGKSPWSQLICASTIPNPPLVPGSLNSTSTDTTITLSWEGTEGAQSYVLEADGEEISGLIDTVYVHSGLAPGSVHRYRVKAVNSGGESDWSVMHEAITQEIISGAPVIIIGEVTESTIEISWNEEEGATGYELEADGVVSVLENQTSIVLTGLGEGTTHLYRVRPLFGEETGPWSTIVSVQTLPGIIENIEINTAKGSILLTWEAVQGASGYVIEADGTEINIGSVNRYLHENLQPGTDHTYRVRARNLSGYGAYSQLIQASTLREISYEPVNIIATPESEKIVLSWDIIAGVSGYQIEIDGETIVDVEGAAYIHECLLPGTQHIYRVRSVIGEEFSDWSEAVSAQTLPEPPDAPEITDIIATDSSVTIFWDAVLNATAYEVEADGFLVMVGQVTSYLDYGLSSQSQHKYRVRAVGEGGKSLWSTEKEILTLTGVPGVPINLTATTSGDAIQFNWAAVAGADEYEAEIDGVIEAVGSNTSVIIDSLSPGTLHTLRVRAITEGMAGPWSGQMSISTLLGIPANITSTVNGNLITFSWDAVPGADAYDIRIDGVLIENISDTSYTTTTLSSGTRHTISVRAKNAVTVSEWSDTFSQNTPGTPVVLDCTEDEVFDLYLSANDVDDFTRYIFTIEYNPNELELIDLCSLTPEFERTAGNITGTGLRIVDVNEGKIVFTMFAFIEPGRMWTGTINIMKFRAKLNGQVTVSYSIQ